jgi:hypothetical protein
VINVAIYFNVVLVRCDLTGCSAYLAFKGARIGQEFVEAEIRSQGWGTPAMGGRNLHYCPEHSTESSPSTVEKRDE